MTDRAKVRPGKYAVIDIGTVTTRFMVAQVCSDLSIEVQCKDMCITDLGEGVDKSGMLKAEAIERVLAAVTDYKKRLNAYQNNEGSLPLCKAFATSAARDAQNGKELIAKLAEEGIELEIISGQTEAENTFRGVAQDFDGEVLVLDVGGGSTEIMGPSSLQAGFLTSSERAQTLSSKIRSHSFDIGCRRVTERFFKSDPPQALELCQAKEWIMSQISDCLALFLEPYKERPQLVAVAGTATSVVAMLKQMEVYDSSYVHKAQVSFDELKELYEALSVMTQKELKSVIGLHPKRASVIVAGILIVLCFMECADLSSFVVSESDSLQGGILRLASRQ